MKPKPDSDELLTAWIDDPASLSGTERAELAALVERSAELSREADETRQLLGRLRDAAAPGQEPAWHEFERTLRDRIERERPGPVARWLARWWKPGLGLGLAVAAAAIVIATRHEPSTEPAAPGVQAAARTPDAGVPAKPAVPEPMTPDDDAPFAIGSIGAVGNDDLDDDGVVAAVAAELELDLGDDDELAPEDGLVPELALDWVDELDDDQMERVDAWLAQK